VGGGPARGGRFIKRDNPLRSGGEVLGEEKNVFNKKKGKQSGGGKCDKILKLHRGSSGKEEVSGINGREGGGGLGWLARRTRSIQAGYWGHKGGCVGEKILCNQEKKEGLRTGQKDVRVPGGRVRQGRFKSGNPEEGGGRDFGFSSSRAVRAVG